MMDFLADENFPYQAIKNLRNNGLNVLSIAEEYFGIPDNEVLEIANKTNRIILTLDSDFGELIFKHKLVCMTGIIYLRFSNFTSLSITNIIINILQKKDLKIENNITVIDENNIRQRVIRKTNG